MLVFWWSHALKQPRITHGQSCVTIYVYAPTPNFRMCTWLSWQQLVIRFTFGHRRWQLEAALGAEATKGSIFLPKDVVPVTSWCSIFGGLGPHNFLLGIGGYGNHNRSGEDGVFVLLPTCHITI